MGGDDGATSAKRSFRSFCNQNAQMLGLTMTHSRLSESIADAQPHPPLAKRTGGGGLVAGTTGGSVVTSRLG